MKPIIKKWIVLGSTVSLLTCWTELEAQTLPASSFARVELILQMDRIDPQKRISPLLTGKFCEHLGWNIYNGMDAQILRNPTFGDYKFRVGPMSPDGIASFAWDPTRIKQRMTEQAIRYGWPRKALEELFASWKAGLACFWTRVPSAQAVRVSPEPGTNGSRAQRIETLQPRAGVAQWTWLPLHRVHRFEVEVYGRAVESAELFVQVKDEDGQVVEECPVGTLRPEWSRLQGSLELPQTVRPDGRFQVAVLTKKPANIVLQYVFLRPADHIEGFDPDVVRLLRASHLPILRWPGGNFVSGYHWRDGVGPIEKRPSRPNYAWGGIEPNTFGTDEFLRFCRVVGCEPLICVNAGSGTPEEAAAWVEYCNGDTNTPMGRLRATNGHPEPYRVKYWEIGNELWGRWQYFWTTPEGYVDRYRRFVRAMRAVDPSIHILACGAPVLWGEDWNQTVIHSLGTELEALTDHPLIGGSVPQTVDPVDVFRDFMAIPRLLEKRWRAMEKLMRQNQIPHPRLAVTELQMFAHVGGRGDRDKPIRLTAENLPRQDTISEALYDVLIYHACVRLTPFVELVTHSATVNHGGGLRKERERVWANPCYYARSAFHALAGAQIIPIEIQAQRLRAPRVLPNIRHVPEALIYPSVDAVAGLDRKGQVWVSMVNCYAGKPVEVTVRVRSATPASIGSLWLLYGKTPWSRNTLEHPHEVVPIKKQIRAEGNKFCVTLPSYCVARLGFSLKDN